MCETRISPYETTNQSAWTLLVTLRIWFTLAALALNTHTPFFGKKHLRNHPAGSCPTFQLIAYNTLSAIQAIHHNYEHVVAGSHECNELGKNYPSNSWSNTTHRDITFQVKHFPKPFVSPKPSGWLVFVRESICLFTCW